MKNQGKNKMNTTSSISNMIERIIRPVHSGEVIADILEDLEIKPIPLAKRL